jgi:hypothetical protein
VTLNVAAIVTLHSDQKANHFWIMLWLASGLSRQRMILAVGMVRRVRRRPESQPVGRRLPQQSLFEVPELG